MRYKLFMFDLDETVWTIDQQKLGTAVTGPFKVIDNREVRSATAQVRLFPGVRALLQNLHSRGKYISLASRSDPEVCDELLQAFGIAQYFSYSQYGWQEKSQAVLNVIQAIEENEKETIAAHEVLFVDDWRGNVDAVRATGASALLFGRDVRSIQELGNILT